MEMGMQKDQTTASPRTEGTTIIGKRVRHPQARSDVANIHVHGPEAQYVSVLPPFHEYKQPILRHRYPLSQGADDRYGHFKQLGDDFRPAREAV